MVNVEEENIWPEYSTAVGGEEETSESDVDSEDEQHIVAGDTETEPETEGDIITEGSETSETPKVPTIEREASEDEFSEEDQEGGFEDDEDDEDDEDSEEGLYGGFQHDLSTILGSIFIDPATSKNIAQILTDISKTLDKLSKKK